MSIRGLVVRLAAAATLAACGGVPFETIALVASDAGSDAPSSSSGGKGGTDGDPDTSAPARDSAAPDAGDEGGIAPPDGDGGAGDGACSVMHSTGVAACARETFVDCTSGVALASAEDACRACDGDTGACLEMADCPDPSGPGYSLVACGPVGGPEGSPLYACWGFRGRLAGYVHVLPWITDGGAAPDECPTVDDPRWY